MCIVRPDPACTGLAWSYYDHFSGYFPCVGKDGIVKTANYCRIITAVGSMTYQVDNIRIKQRLIGAIFQVNG